MTNRGILISLRGFAAVLAASGALLSNACSPSGGGTSPTDAGADSGGPRGTGMTVMQSIGSSGGSVSLESASLQVPAGAVPGNVTISVTSSPQAPPSGYVALTPVYVFGPAGTTFAQPVTVTFDVPSGAVDPVVVWSRLGGDGFDTLETTREGNRVAARNTHFSECFVVERPSSDAGTGVCAAPRTLCGSECVSLQNNSRHCGACGNACTTTRPNSASNCVAGACQVSCSDAYRDCDGNAANGCEQAIFDDPANCGSCGVTCTAGQICQAGRCTTVRDAGADATTDAQTDGGVLDARADAGALDATADARTDAPVSDVAPDRYADGAAMPNCTAPTTACLDRCVNLASDTANCGACGNVCRTSAGGMVATCTAGSCGSMCAASQRDCNANTSDGCEANITSSVAHCGACGNACPAGDGQMPLCEGGTCYRLCAAGRLDCDGNAANGCEVTAATDARNCGACGVVCPSGTCSAGRCVPVADAGVEAGADAGAAVDAGATTDAASTTDASTGTDAASAVDTGLCGVGQTLCSGSCVYLNSDPEHCGSCSTVCPPAGPNQRRFCEVTCQLQCTSGYTDCNGNPTDGCETAWLTDRNNCGACNNVCPSGQVCVSGSCRLDCASGTSQCGSACVNLQTDRANCGVCGRACTSTQACTSGTCTTPTCGSGTTNCSGTCVTLPYDPANCGACARSCTNTQYCAASTCTACPSGRTRCPGTNACSDLNTNAQNCGACGNVCTPAYAGGTGVCTAGVCGTACASYRANCNGTLSDGCEVDTMNDANNCGGCGIVCPSGQRCVESTCM